MKLLYCAHCGDIVRLFPEKRFCRCGKSWGHYLDDGATTVQTWPGLSLGIANPDFVQAQQAFGDDVTRFSPLLTMRCWINPASEPDVKFVVGAPTEGTDEPGDTGGGLDEAGQQTADA
ncbi:hypothetical protein KZZ52_37250 [Dactylosporangium sp. AC04546]|uniref:hypothetical protein n=1 Tax=Dactylosporangium sp. AC04546 TaxID=2862460 RepID=UPI001EDDF168|nr:hypothetical protein [Dactylosporangium sp. AC04546]WVK79614.1 hypothetical protein KZZ52_37250 [Dactylosporangium sp. AC04546]